MTYRVTRNSEQQPAIVMEDEPYGKALAAAPAQREPELDQGLWLVMVFAAWSVPDINAIQVALDVARHFGGRINLGVRPLDNFEENAAWLPDVKDTGLSPLWIGLNDGRVCMSKHGLLTAQELVDAISASCPV
jgi:hypothetical protein